MLTRSRQEVAIPPPPPHAHVPRCYARPGGSCRRQVHARERLLPQQHPAWQLCSLSSCERLPRPASVPKRRPFLKTLQASSQAGCSNRVALPQRPYRCVPTNPHRRGAPAQLFQALNFFLFRNHLAIQATHKAQPLSPSASAAAAAPAPSQAARHTADRRVAEAGAPQHPTQRPAA